MSDGGKRRIRVTARILLALLVTAALMLGAAWTALWLESRGTVSARGSGHDALWLGHAWVDGRKSQSDVDALAQQLRTTGIRDLFVHTGPFTDDGYLDPGLFPRARWFTDAIHQALPGVRVQAWLGAHQIPPDPLADIAHVLDQGFDGIHYDFEPIADGDPGLPAVLRKTRTLTRERHVLLSVSAIHTEPWPGVAACVATLPSKWALWSQDYLRRVALEVDQVAVMSYDTSLPTEATYAGYVRRATESALQAVPKDVALFMGVPAYHDQGFYHRQTAETVAAAVRGVRLASVGQSTDREFGVALYVDFAAAESDWAAYREGWA